MKKEEFAGKMKEKLNFTFNLMDSIRREGLEDLMTIRLAKQNAFKREQKRLSKKIGVGHPRLKKLETKIQYTDSMKKNLDVLITEAKTTADPVDSETWKIHGKVVGKNNRGIKGLSVGLFDKKGKWQRELGFGRTDSNGYFTITYSLVGEEKKKISKETKLFLYVSDKKQKVLHKGSEPLFYSPGEIDYMAITVSEEGDIYIPPKPPPDEPVSPTGKWVVKGRVTDKNGKSLSGLTVNLYDKDLIFDDILGTTKTDEEGSFMFSFETEKLRDLAEANPDIYLKVLDKRGKVKYASRKPVKFTVGKVDEFKVKIKS